MGEQSDCKDLVVIKLTFIHNRQESGKSFLLKTIQDNTNITLSRCEAGSNMSRIPSCDKLTTRSICRGL